LIRPGLGETGLRRREAAAASGRRSSKTGILFLLPQIVLPFARIRLQKAWERSLSLTSIFDQARKKEVTMKRQILAVILAGPLLFGLPILQTLRGQTCSDDEGMVKSYVQGINSLVETVQKENLSDFEKDYHEQSCLSRINLSIEIVNSLIACLNKAAKDPADTPAQTAAIQSKLQTYAKLESALEQDRDSLKAAKNPKAAKSIIEMFVLTV
jgi:hypothetical protein